MVSMVADGEQTIDLRPCSCSSMLASLERGLEGTLADLWWQAMLGMGGAKAKPLFAGNGREGKLLQWCLPGFGYLLYIVKRCRQLVS
jgi:hypothetical protein